MNALTSTWNDRQLALIRRTVAKDTNSDEFEQFVHIARHTRLDPLRRQIYCFVFHKNDENKRQLTTVTSIGGYRSIAERTGAYRPDDKAPRYEMGAKDAKTNPHGIVRAEVTVYKHSHGEWFPVVGEAWWDEYVPLYNGAIDTKKTGWVKMPRIMIAKCAEANALRKAWPDDFAMLHAEEELDRAHSLDLSATELADNAETEAKLQLIGGRHALVVDWCDGSPLARIPEGKFCDDVLQWAGAKDRCATELRAWFQRNNAARGEFKARHGGEYLEFHKAFERRINELEAAEQAEAAA